jgi:hypothetical protein
MAKYGTKRSKLAHPAVAGAVGGIVAAAVMLLVATVVSATKGASGLEPVRLIGATFMGEEAMSRPVLSSVLGLVTHVIVGASFGVLFGYATQRIRSGPLLLTAGLAYAAAIFLVMTYAVLPWVNPLMAARMEPGWFFLYHLTFGLLLPATLLVAWQRPIDQWFHDEGDMVRPRP